MLHLEKPLANDEVHSIDPETSQTTSIQLLNKNSQDRQMVLLPTVKVRIKCNHDEFIIANCLLDRGSQASFITSRLATNLVIKTQNCNLKVTGISQNTSNVQKMVHIELESLISNYKLNTTWYVVDNITSHFPDFKIDVSNLKLPSDITLSDPEFNTPKNIDILLLMQTYLFKLLEQATLKFLVPISYFKIPC